MDVNKKLIQSICYLLPSIAILPFAVPALEVDASYGKRQGEVIYQIGGQMTLDTGESGRVRFPISELRFQTNTPVVNLQLNHLFENEWLVSVSATKNIATNAGDMQDSDWGINYYFVDPNAFPRDSLDIYSESRLTLDALDLQIQLQKKVVLGVAPLWDVFIGAGILLQRYDFSAFDTLQSYPSTPDRPTDVLSGKTITYRYEARMPFASARLTRSINHKASVEIFAMYSPLLEVEDYDDHILRDKTSTGNSDGWGLKLNASVNYAIGYSTSVFLSLAYLKTVANGSQIQKFSNNEDISSAKIGLRNTNEQRSVNIGFVHTF